MPSQNDSRFNAGFLTIQHKGKAIPTSVGSKTYEALYGGTSPNSLLGLSLKQIPLGFANRPDLIANLFLKSPSLWWKVCEANNIFDVFEQLQSGDGIYLP
jgi:hypothetical protein